MKSRDRDVHVEHYNLAELIRVLSQRADLDRVVPLGWDQPHSYRGDYSDLAVEPVRDVSIRSMLETLRSADGETFTGWKGGEFQMSAYTLVWLAHRGDTGESIGATLLGLMLDGAAPRVVHPGPVS